LEQSVLGPIGGSLTDSLQSLTMRVMRDVLTFPAADRAVLIYALAYILSIWLGFSCVIQQLSTVATLLRWLVLFTLYESEAGGKIFGNFSEKLHFRRSLHYYMHSPLLTLKIIRQRLRHLLDSWLIDTFVNWMMMILVNQEPSNL
jgi:hypothetical protein